MCANYSLTDRERSLTGHRCLADATHKCLAPTRRQRMGLRRGLGVTAQLDRGQGGKYMAVVRGGFQGEGGGGVVGGLILHSFI